MLSAPVSAIHIEKVFGMVLDPADLLDDIPLAEIVEAIAESARSGP
ncbi:MAG: hypothetical protein GDA49_11735 [Rhodospirillales bacterium]|nr:hypothetical protein [Rhodospirillales bacterium]